MAQVPAGRQGTPDEIAAAVAFLVSAEASSPCRAARGPFGRSNTLALQDPGIRKNFAWDPGWVGKISTRTLLLWTDHDPTGGLDEAELLLDWLPDARLHVIEDAGHWPQWEKREEFLRAHRDFLLDDVAVETAP